MKITGMRCNQCNKTHYTDPFTIGDYLPKGWFALRIAGGGLDEHFCSRECLKKLVTSEAHLTVPQGPADATPKVIGATVGGRIEYE
jgi:hypothetical protein